jgi:competence protein ComEC
MPFIASGALAYALGVLAAASLSRQTAWTCVLLASAIAIAGTLARRHAAAAWGALLTAGTLIGLATAAGDQSCRQRLLNASSWTVEMLGPALGSGAAPATIRDGSCAVHTSLLIARGRAGVGDLATVHGVASLDPRGLVIARATVADVRGRHSAATLRAAVGRRIDHLFGPDASIVRALVIADMSAIPIEQRDRYARAGLVHMLSVSGLHVAIIALALELLASAVRLPTNPARVGTLFLLAAYVIGIGAPPPAVRAAVMFGVLVVCRVAQRPTSPWAVLAIGAVAPLADPRIVIDLGWQLSVAGTVALVAGGSLAARIVPRSWNGRRRSIARALAVSLVATVVTAPLVAYNFGQLALLGPVTNLLADPLMAVLQPALFLALCVPVGPVERLAADASHALLAGFDAIATYAAALPGGAPAVLPTTLAACAGGAMAVAIVAACISDRPARAGFVALACLAILIGEPLVTPVRDATELHLLDVGQGDAIAIRTRAGHWVVVDAGRAWTTGDAGRSVVVPYIARRGGSVALFVLSHPHADHVGGAASLFRALHPRRFLDPGYVGTTPAYLAALAEARSERMPWQRVRPGDSVVVDEVVLTELAPDSSWAAGLDDANLASSVLVARVGDVRILLTGDAEAAEEEWLLDHARTALRADVLKVAHHGSATSSTSRFLAAVRPRLALVSVGARNTYGHPDPAVVSALGAGGAAVMRTDLDGTVIVRTDGRALDVEARGVRWSVPDRAHAPSSAAPP